MIYGNTNIDLLTLTESEIKETESFYENLKVTEDNSPLSLSMTSYNIYAEMQYNFIITLGIMKENDMILSEGENKIVNWFIAKAKLIMAKAVEFFKNILAKLKNYFNIYKNKFKGAQNRTWISTFGPNIKNLANNASPEQLKAFSRPLPMFRTNIGDICIDQSLSFLNSATTQYRTNITDRDIREEKLERSSKELLLEKKKIEEGYMYSLFSQFRSKDSVNFIDIYNAKKSDEDKIKGNTSFNMSSKTVDYSSLVPNDVVMLGDDRDGVIGKIDSAGTSKAIEAASGNVKAIADAYFTSDIDKQFNGEDILANFKIICDNACGVEAEVVQRNFIKADKTLQSIIKNLNEMDKKIEKTLSGSNNDRISSLRHTMIVNLLNIYMIAEMNMSTMIISHSAAIACKMQKYFDLLSEFKGYLQKLA